MRGWQLMRACVADVCVYGSRCVHVWQSACVCGINVCVAVDARVHVAVNAYTTQHCQCVHEGGVMQAGGEQFELVSSLESESQARA